MTERNVTWVVCEMDQDMKENVEKQVNKAIDATEQDKANVNQSEKWISQYIKKFFDTTYGPNWHCCVGKHFASYVTYQSKHYIFFYLG